MHGHMDVKFKRNILPYLWTEVGKQHAFIDCPVPNLS